MWVLDSTGDCLGGRRLWLRPGKKYLFGRLSQGGVDHAISHASVSGKHMTIEVSPVVLRDGTRTHARTKLTVTDLNSKCGTTVDGDLLKGDERVLIGDDHKLIVGRCPGPLRITWEPVVLSFSFSSKEMKAEDPLVKVRSRLEDLDIKTVIPYLVDHTTHVVQSKRNTAKGLQALINGKYIVCYSFIDALVHATTPSDNHTGLSPLETDFESAWPDANEYIPPAGNEPISRPAGAFSPNSSRVNVFEEYTFVFGDAAQFENLQAAINNGQGKALFYEVKYGVTVAADIVRFMTEASGHKGVGGERDGPGGVVLVRFRSKGEHESWSIEVGNEVALMTDQRVIEQSEFLDAILGNDASPLCRRLPREEVSSQVSVTAESEQQPSIITSNPASPPSPPVRETQKSKGTRARKFVSKMKTFDDGFDMDSVPVYNTPGNDDPISQMEYEPEPSQANQPLATKDDNEETEEDIMADLLPGTRAMKRRRAEMGDTPHENHPTVVPEAPKRKRVKLDVLEAARKHREEEEQQRLAEENPRLSHDVDIEGLKNLAIIEEMEIPVRDPPVREENIISDRWDKRWNGRKNYKRFRRKGGLQHERQRVQSVIVPLEAVTRKSFGIGEHYWVSNSNQASPERQESSLSRAASRAVSRVPETQVSELSTTSRSQPSVALTDSQDTVPPSRKQKKRPRESRDSDSEEELQFRFRRKR
ncbi:hypothetical protein N7495_007359 [Penicillium taxi]|uniref:uncharacterized protein n=1 Tax=Penicillium taxi TaxID=168475 RepID=UPI0025455ED3|nr:uncharacterized protein N7495_007359 [Penicillium taxi]KAJ5895668.1 hypothetical protein N7495_007359 [Penicillium taxi]